MPDRQCSARPISGALAFVFSFKSDGRLAIQRQEGRHQDFLILQHTSDKAAHRNEC